MLKILNTLLFGLILISINCSYVSAQASMKSPVEWKVQSKKLPTGKIEISAKAIMPMAWNIYSQFTEENGPIPTTFEIDTKEVKFTEASKVIKEYDALFEVNVLKFKDKAEFIYEADSSDEGKTVSITYMTCDGARCLPPVTIDFVITTN